MSYPSMETSAASGAPVELYEFTYTGKAFRYTSADESVESGGVLYSPIPVGRSVLQPSDSREKSNLSIDIPISTALADIFRISPPGEEVWLTVYRLHRGDGNRLAVWIGRVVNARFDEFEMGLELESIMSSVQRTILPRSYQKGCPHLLYGVGCHADPTTYRVTTTADNISGDIVTIGGATPVNDYYAGGTLSYLSTITGVVERRFVAGNTGLNLSLDRQPVGLLTGMTVELLPGCNHTLSDCKNKFNNVLNYGGQPFIPEKNPAGGAVIY